jgi:hypothetical protein
MEDATPPLAPRQSMFLVVLAVTLKVFGWVIMADAVAELPQLSCTVTV